MITAGRLFWIRLRSNGKRQLRAWNSVMDWTVWLYLLIPGLIIGGGLYRELWTDMPSWAGNVPWLIIYPFVLFIVMLLGHIRVFVEDADRLFLLQRPEWLQALKRRGILYSFATKAAILLLPYALLLPFLIVVEGMTWLGIVLAYGYTLCMGMTVSLGMHVLHGRRKGWRRHAVEVFVVLLFAAAYLIPMTAGGQGTELLGLSIAAGMLLMAGMLWLAFRSAIQFDAEVKLENEARHRSTELLMSQVIESKPSLRLKRPFFFRKSQRLFRRSDAGTMLAEMRLKAFLRGMTHLRVWASFISASMYAVILVPGPVAAFLVIALAMVGSSWLQLQWKQWYAEPFVAQFRWSEQDAKRGARLSRFWLLLPPMLAWSAVAGFKLAGIWAAVPAAVLCGIVWWACSSPHQKTPSHVQ
ncbi:ABC transporter permease [Paenibacillus arenilitoris]|uniref:ABC transporter permease n=1 Tax=Paenibacillus arenilitoris TaxID=2772299 RepID=A0A927CNN0_9BACL|nr:ABC transporter permease [Paenibacillus arenilitoris]MBD2871334.1 ABC transporter permease [Paenibacillus arenilitoris]